MLEEEVEVCAPSREIGGEEQVAVPLGEVAVDEAAGLEAERAPVDRSRDPRREHGAQLGRGVVGIGEDVLEERVVRAHGARARTDGSVAN
jgi:hypothetical protein